MLYSCKRETSRALELTSTIATTAVAATIAVLAVAMTLPLGTLASLRLGVV